MKKTIGVTLMAMMLAAGCATSTPQASQPRAEAKTAPTTAEPTTTQEPTTTIDSEGQEAADVTTTGPCVSDDFGLISMPIAVTNSSTKRSDYTIEGVIEQGGAKVGDIVAYVENVDAGGKALSKMSSLDTVKGDIACRIVKVDRFEAL
jgi:ABC-type Fe3+-hydroxamate transport system substrate-binding protein